MSSLLFKILLCVSLMCVQECLSSKILLLFPSPSPSHLIVGKALAKTLAERGHELTVVSQYPQSKPLKNYRDVKIDFENNLEGMVINFLKNGGGGGMSLISSFPEMVEFNLKLGNATVNNPEMQQIMKEESFDLVIVGFFFNHYLIGLGDHFKCPTMILSTAGATSLTNKIIGNPLEISAVSHLFLKFKNSMNFAQRLKNAAIYGIDFVMSQYIEYHQEKYYNLNFPQDKYISYAAAKRNVSLILLNDHFTQDNVRPYVPGMVEVGGLQIKNKPSPLPKHIQEFLDSAKEGAIFFSLGSNAKVSYLPKEKVDILLKTFAKLKQKVIFKWETDTLEGKPDNVLTGKWLPQDDILAHPNVKIFISHAGLGSIAEAKYHGVPVLAMPIFADQMTNGDMLVEEGWGIVNPLSELSEEKFGKAIRELIENPKYKTQAKKLSALYKDRPMNAMDTAVYWTEYVIRHKGAPHMHYPGADQNFIVRNSLDVIGFLALVIYIACKLTKCAAKFFCGLICKKKRIVKKKNE